jgi:acetyltransferase-like isoleucine patch superfamily enzyme
MSTGRASESNISEQAFISMPELLEHPVSVGAQAEVHRDSTIGRFSFVNNASIIYRNVTLGRFSSVARNCEVGVAIHPTDTLSTHSFQYSSAGFRNVDGYADMPRFHHEEHPATFIGSDVWIGAQVIVKAGVRIGHGAVVGAHSTIIGDVPPFSVIVGSPGRIVRMRFESCIIDSLIATHWWDLQFDQIRVLPFHDVPKCIEILDKIREDS